MAKYITKGGKHYGTVNDVVDRIEALEAENARLLHEIQEASDPDFLWGAMDNVADMDATLVDYAAAASRAIRASVAYRRATGGET